MDPTNTAASGVGTKRRYIVDAVTGLLLPLMLIVVFVLDSQKRHEDNLSTGKDTLLGSEVIGIGDDEETTPDPEPTEMAEAKTTAETSEVESKDTKSEDPIEPLPTKKAEDPIEPLPTKKAGSQDSAEAQVALVPAEKVQVASDGLVARMSIPQESIYSQRTAPNRQEQVIKKGGNLISEQAVQDGLNWLARHQAQAGYWSNRNLGNTGVGRCEPGSPCSDAGSSYDAAHTGLALLAFQGGGYFYFNKTKYSDNVRRGLDWLVAQQQNASLSNRNKTMYEHGIASFALSEACALAVAANVEPDPRYLQAAKKSIEFIEKSQHPAGGWRYRPGQAGDTSVSGWQVLALKTAGEAKIPVDERTLNLAVQFFESCEYGDKSGRTGYTGRGGGGVALTGVGMLVHQFLRHEFDSPLIDRAATYLADYVESNWRNGGGRPDYYVWYNCTMAMFQVGGEHWKRWNDVVREQLINRQQKKNCERGSWPPNSQWGGSGGRIYSTALAVLTLEVYYRFADQRKKIEQQDLVRQYLQKGENFILAALTDEDAGKRWAAVAVARQKRLRVADQLIPLLRDSAADVRAETYRALVDLAEGIHYSQPPGEMRGDQDAAVARWTEWRNRRELLAGFARKPETEVLEAMKSADADRRWAAVAEARRRRLDLADELVSLLGDADLLIRREAHHALVQVAGGVDYGSTAGGATADVASKRWQTWRDRRKLLREFSLKNRDELLTAFSEGDPDRRWAAVAVVRERRLHAPVQLIAMLRDADELVREEAHRALAQSADDVDFGPALGAADAEITDAEEKWSKWWSEQHEKREQRAEGSLKSAEILWKRGKQDEARKRYQRIVDDYAGTKAASKAAARLRE